MKRSILLIAVGALALLWSSPHAAGMGNRHVVFHDGFAFAGHPHFGGPRIIIVERPFFFAHPHFVQRRFFVERRVFVVPRGEVFFFGNGIVIVR